MKRPRCHDRRTLSITSQVREASDDVGGNWYFGNPNGRSSAYRSLHIDTSKSAISFKDFAMDERYPDFPHYPSFPGRFDGPAIHSHQYVDPSEPLGLEGKRVLVVGIGNSAVDITSELSRKGVAERVFISTRSGAWVIPKYILGRP